MISKILYNSCMVSMVVIVFCACHSGRIISGRYYYENQKILDSTEQLYRHLYEKNPFSVEFTDNTFKYVSLEIITDTLSYNYEFQTNEPRLKDTLLKYGLNEPGFFRLLKQMKEVHCTWINNLDYYTDGNKKVLTFISIRPVRLNSLFDNRKYYILTYFSQPQYFNSEGMLLDNRRLRKLRRINDEIFKRINDKVCYTISERFR
jgi:hypothetical protein